MMKRLNRKLCLSGSVLMGGVFLLLLNMLSPPIEHEAEKRTKDLPDKKLRYHSPLEEAPILTVASYDVETDQVARQRAVNENAVNNHRLFMPQMARRSNRHGWRTLKYHFPSSVIIKRMADRINSLKAEQNNQTDN